jgi:hypothetical protein
LLKVIDLGFGRTGTMSLKYALEELDFAKCYHFIELYDNPEHPPIWLSASRGEPVDWERIFEGYQATVYWSPCYDYLELLKRYPDAKVILTVRDPEKWYQSMHDTIYKFNRLTFLRKVFLLTMGLFKPEFKRLYAVWHLQEQTTWQKTFKGQFHNKKYAIEVFTNHIEEIKSKVPADRLLVFNIKDGWEPLCHFLKVPVPDTPFPRVNDSTSFIELRSKLFKKWPFGDKNKK